MWLIRLVIAICFAGSFASGALPRASADGPLVIAPQNPTLYGQVGEPFYYDFTQDVSAGLPPYAFNISFSDVPFTVTTGGQLYGTPVEPLVVAIDVTVADSTEGSPQIAATTYSLVIEPGYAAPSGDAPEMLSGNEARFMEGNGGRFWFQVTGSEPMAFSVLPESDGFAVDSDARTLTVSSEVPAGDYRFTVLAENEFGRATQELTIHVSPQRQSEPETPPVFTSADRVPFTAGYGGTHQLTAEGAEPIVFSAAELPDGITLESNLLTVSPDARVGTYPLTITARNAGGMTVQQLTFQVAAATQESGAPSFTSADHVMLQAGVSHSHRFEVIGEGSMHFSITPQSDLFVLDGDTLHVSADAPTGLHTFEVLVESPYGKATQLLTLSIVADPSNERQPPTITSANDITFLEGFGGAHRLTADGAEPIGFSVDRLPEGFSLEGDLMTVSIHASPGIYQLGILARNDAGTATQTLTVNVIAGPTDVPRDPVFTSPDAVQFVVGEGGTHRFTSGGYGLTTYSIQPTSEHFTLSDDQTLLIASEAAPPGDYVFRVTAENAYGTATQMLTVSITKPHVQETAFTSADAAKFTQGVGGVHTFAAEKDVVFTIDEALPDGVRLSGSILIVGGKAQEGTFALTVRAWIGTQLVATQRFTLLIDTVRPSGEPPVITSADSVRFMAYYGGEHVFAATGRQPICYSIDSLPDGFELDGLRGVLTASPLAEAGAYHLAVTAENGIAPAATQALTVEILPGPADIDTPPTFISAGAAAFTQGVGGTHSFLAVGYGLISYAIKEPMPQGVTLEGNTLLVSPNAPAGEYALTVIASLPRPFPCTETQAFTLTIHSGVPVAEPPTITSDNSATFVAGIAGTHQFVVSGSEPILLTIEGSLPAGVRLEGMTLFVTETASEGVCPLVVHASNSVSPDARQAFTLRIVQPGISPEIIGPDSVRFEYGKGGTYTFAATGDSPVMFSILDPLPGGVTMNGATLSIGQTAPIGEFPLTVRASNGTNPDNTRQFTLEVIDAKSVTFIEWTAPEATKAPPQVASSSPSRTANQQTAFASVAGLSLEEIIRVTDLPPLTSAQQSEIADADAQMALPIDLSLVPDSGVDIPLVVHGDEQVGMLQIRPSGAMSGFSFALNLTNGRVSGAEALQVIPFADILQSLEGTQPPGSTALQMIGLDPSAQDRKKTHADDPTFHPFGEPVSARGAVLVFAGIELQYEPDSGDAYERDPDQYAEWMRLLGGLAAHIAVRH